MKFKRLAAALVACLALSVPHAASAAPWYLVWVDDRVFIMLDVETIQETDGAKQAWGYVVTKKAGEFVYMGVHEAFDCEGKRKRLIVGHLFRRDATVTETWESSGGWKNARPGSVEGHWLEAVCDPASLDPEWFAGEGRTLAQIFEGGAAMLDRARQQAEGSGRR